MRARGVVYAAALAGLLTQAPAAMGADILIAAVGPLAVTTSTGQYAMFGEELTRGAEMAVRDINDASGINGQRLRLLLADDACDPAQAVGVAEALVRQQVVFVAGHFCSGASIEASRIYHQAGVLMITPSSINSRLTEQGFRNVFRTCGRDDAQGTFAANYALDELRAERIAIVQDGTAFGKGIADEFKRQLDRRGVRAAMYEPIAQGQKEFGGLIDRMREAGIQLVYFGTYHAEGGLFVRQAHQHGLHAVMMVNSAMVNREFWELAGQGGEGTLMTFAPDPRRLPSAVELVRRFEAEGYTPEGYTLNTYAAIQVFAEAARRAGSTALEGLTQALHQGTFDTALGTISFDEKGDVEGFEYAMYRWREGSYAEICCRSEEAEADALNGIGSR
jgi:branched-chain amino acid transport system substrate-binding protein